MFKSIIFGLGIFAALFAMLMFSGKLPIGAGKGADTPTGDVLVWGTLPQNEVESLFQNINSTTKTYRISYEEISEDTFSSELVGALASGRGPDVIIAPYQIILEQRARIFPFPVADYPKYNLKGINEGKFRDLYVDGASIFYTEIGALALPLSISPLVLFYNRTLFSNAGVVDPPTKWANMEDTVSKLTVIDKNGKLVQSGIALGAYNNINAAKDIIMTLVSQLGQIPVLRVVQGSDERFSVLANSPVSSEESVHPLTSSARFFTQYSDPNKKTYSWSSLLPDAQDEFVAEKLAMYIGYSDEASLIKAKNSRIDFGVKLLPQIKTGPQDKKVTGMKLYGISTLKRSSNLNASFTVQTLLSGAQSRSMAGIARGFSPLKTSINEDSNLTEEYRTSILNAKGWTDISQSRSDEMIKTMINDINSGRKNVSEAAEAFVTKLTESYSR